MSKIVAVTMRIEFRMSQYRWKIPWISMSMAMAQRFTQTAEESLEAYILEEQKLPQVSLIPSIVRLTKISIVARIAQIMVPLRARIIKGGQKARIREMLSVNCRMMMLIVRMRASVPEPRFITLWIKEKLIPKDQNSFQWKQKVVTNSQIMCRPIMYCYGLSSRFRRQGSSLDLISFIENYNSMSEIPQGSMMTEGPSTEVESNVVQSNFPQISNEKMVLDRIEESVKSLQTRIQHLLKEKCRNQKKLQQAFQDSVSLVQRKMQQVGQRRQITEFHRKKERLQESNQMRVKQLRHRQYQEMAAVKESLGEIKKEERDTIRQMSRKNQQVIDESRRQLLDKKRNMVQQLRKDKENSRLEHQKQQQEIKLSKQKQKQQQQRLEQERKTRLLLQLKKMQRTQRQLLDNIRLTSSNINQFSSLTKVTSNMTVEDFEDMLRDVKKQRGNNVTQKILEYILTRRMEILREDKRNTITNTRASTWKKQQPKHETPNQATHEAQSDVPPRPIILSPEMIDS